MTPQAANLAAKVKKYKTARWSLLVVIIMTLVNVITVNAAGFYFVFSAAFPLLFVDLTAVAGGDPLSIVFLIGCIIVFAAYVVCFFLSKKSYIPLIIVTVLYAIDCALILWLAIGLLEISFFIDIAFHAWCMFIIGSSVKAGMDLSKASPYGVGITENQLAEICAPEAGAGNSFAPAEMPAEKKNDLPDSPIIRDFSGKGRVMICGNYYGREIKVVYRPICYEFVVDGKVYAQHKNIVWKKLEMSCNVGGVAYRYSLNGFNMNAQLVANGEVIALK